MVLKVFSVYDSKVGLFMQPFFFSSNGQALRAWETTVNDPQTMFKRYPNDFTLYELGSFDETSGKFKELDSKVNLGSALDFVKGPEQQALPLRGLNSSADEAATLFREKKELKHV